MGKPNQANLRWPWLVVMAATSFIVMLFLCTGSVLYAFNPSPDANIMMTIGKGGLHGIMPYQGMFDNRGPLIYALYTLVAWVSYRSFLLIYLLESVLLFIDLVFSYRILRRFISHRLALPLSFMIIPLMFNEYFFQHGDTPESLVLPMLLFTFDQLLANEELRFQPWQLIVQGLLVGITFWMKYTMIFPWAGIGLVMAISYLFQKRFRDLGQLVGFGAVGFAIVTIPVLLVYRVHHILLQMLRVYFWFNMKYYKHTNFDLTQLIKMAQSDVVTRWVEIMCGLTLVAIVLLPRVKPLMKCLLATSLILETLMIITVKVTATYYFTLIGGFSIFLIVLIGLGLQKLPNMVSDNPILALIIVSVTLIATFSSNQNYRYSRLFPHNQLYSYDQKQTEPYQLRFAKIIDRSSDRSLLCYRTIDVSMFTALGTLPNQKYFVQNNLYYPPMHKAQVKALKSLKNKYVLTISLPPKLNDVASMKSIRKLMRNKTLKRHYHVVATAEVLKYTSGVHQYPLKYYLYERN